LVDAYLAKRGLPAGMVSVIGHMVDLPVRDLPGPEGEPGAVVDGDVWRRILKRGSPKLEYRLLFPYAGVQHALAGSETFYRYMQQLRAEFGEVFAHFGDSDVVSLVKPWGGGRSVFDVYADEIHRSRSRVGDRRSPLVRLGGAAGYSAAEVDYGLDGVAKGSPSVAAKLTVLLSQAHQLWAGVLDQGKYPMGYFSEQNVLFNTRYMGKVLTRDGVQAGLLSSMSQEAAVKLDGFAFGHGVHKWMTDFGLNTPRHSLFLPDPEAQVLTSVRGTKRTFTIEHLKAVATEQPDGGWEPKKPRRTLHWLGNGKAASNFSFRPGGLVGRPEGTVGFGRPRVEALFDLTTYLDMPPSEKKQLAREKLHGWYQINAAFDDVVRMLDQPLDDLLIHILYYELYSLPASWDEPGGLDEALTEVIGQLDKLGLGAAEPEPVKAMDLRAREAALPPKLRRKIQTKIRQGGHASSPAASLSSLTSLSSSEEEQSDTSAEDTPEEPESGDSSSDRPLWPPPHSIAPPRTGAPPTPRAPSEVAGLPAATDRASEKGARACPPTGQQVFNREDAEGLFEKHVAPLRDEVLPKIDRRKVFWTVLTSKMRNDGGIPVRSKHKS